MAISAKPPTFSVNGFLPTTNPLSYPCKTAIFGIPFLFYSFNLPNEIQNRTDGIQGTILKKTFLTPISLLF
ncbi:MAG: hypothetical protein CMC14_12260 [Flavobacteriaceae bacterium]|nr:hypothetical protein [Flavobacteriaceae bacterium]